MSCLGKNALVEPQIDVIEPEDVVTNCCKFYSLNLNECSEADCTFANTYRLKML